MDKFDSPEKLCLLNKIRFESNKRGISFDVLYSKFIQWVDVVDGIVPSTMNLENAKVLVDFFLNSEEGNLCYHILMRLRNHNGESELKFSDFIKLSFGNWYKEIDSEWRIVHDGIKWDAISKN